MGASTDLVVAQYEGNKAALKPIYNAPIKVAKGCGGIEKEPKKNYVSMCRSKQFAIIQASTKNRVDVSGHSRPE